MTTYTTTTGEAWRIFENHDGLVIESGEGKKPVHDHQLLAELLALRAQRDWNERRAQILARRVVILNMQQNELLAGLRDTAGRLEMAASDRRGAGDHEDAAGFQGCAERAHKLLAQIQKVRPAAQELGAE